MKDSGRLEVLSVEVEKWMMFTVLRSFRRLTTFGSYHEINLKKRCRNARTLRQVE